MKAKEIAYLIVEFEPQTNHMRVVSFHEDKSSLRDAIVEMRDAGIWYDRLSIMAVDRTIKWSDIVSDDPDVCVEDLHCGSCELTVFTDANGDETMMDKPNSMEPEEAWMRWEAMKHMVGALKRARYHRKRKK